MPIATNAAQASKPALWQKCPGRPLPPPCQGALQPAGPRPRSRLPRRPPTLYLYSAFTSPLGAGTHCDPGKVLRFKTSAPHGQMRKIETQQALRRGRWEETCPGTSSRGWGAGRFVPPLLTTFPEAAGTGRRPCDAGRPFS